MVDLIEFCRGCEHFEEDKTCDPTTDFPIHLCLRYPPDPDGPNTIVIFDESDLCEEAQEKLSKLKQQEAGKQ